MKSGISLIAVIVAAAGLFSIDSQRAEASTLSATQLLNTYNAIVFGNLTSTSEMDGNALVGGAVSGGNYDTHYPHTPTAPSALTVGGNLTGNVNVNGPGLAVGGNLATSNLNLNQGGNVFVGGNLTSGFNANFNGHGNLYVVGSATAGANVTANGGNAYLGGTVKPGANVNANGGGQVFQNSPVPAANNPNIAGQVSSAESELKAYSTQLNKLAANSTITGSGTLTFNAAPNSKGVAVFDINSNAVALLGAATQFQFDLNGAKEVIINVSGVGSTALDIHANFLNSIAPTLGTDTVWNFTDATNLTIGNQFGGDLLAAMANVTTGGNIEGTLVANSVVQNAEIHYDGQQGNLVSPVPLPSALYLLGTAIIGLITFSWRRRAAKTA